MSATTAPMTGVLLAGGESRRMGTDKAALEFDGEPLAARVARVLAEACDEVLVASGDGTRLDRLDLGFPQVADATPGAGPLGGIVAGLERARHPLVAVVAVDMPNASAPLLRLLAEAWSGEDAVVPISPRGPEPLHAVYARTAAPTCRRRLEGPDRSVVGALGELSVRYVGEDEWRTADPGGRFALNLNTPLGRREGGDRWACDGGRRSRLRS